MLSYHELRFQAVSKCDLNLRNHHEKLADGVNFCMMGKEETRELHMGKGYKGYCFILREKLPIKTGQIFHLIVRCFGDRLSALMKECLLQRDNDYFFCQNLEYDRKCTYSHAMRRLAMKTVAPVIITDLWTDYSDIDRVIHYLGSNLNKKYNQAAGEKVMHNPIKDLCLVGEKPCIMDYKNICLAGRKVIVVFKDDELSQKMAFVAMAYGLGEKNTAGFGACFANNDYLYDYMESKGGGENNGK